MSKKITGVDIVVAAFFIFLMVFVASVTAYTVYNEGYKSDVQSVIDCLRDYEQDNLIVIGNAITCVRLETE